jgi:RecA/RadA recombinase
MAAPKKKAKATPVVHAVDAASAAFDEVNYLDCINLMQGQRVKDTMSTGSLSLDLIIGSGCRPGLMGTIFGPEGSGKSTLALSLVSSAQSINIPICMYDPEAGSDPVYMRAMGIDLKYTIEIKDGRKSTLKPGFFYTQPDTGEAVYRHILRVLSKMPIVDDGPPKILFLVDSFAGMASEEVDELGDGGRVADEARMHSYFLKRVVPRLRRRGAILFGTNQMRTAIGSYGSPQQEAGGWALRFWPGYKIRTSCKRVEPDKLGVQTVPVIWRTTKNKAFPPFRSTDMRLMLGRGLDHAYDAFYFLKHLGLLEVKSGRQIIKLDRYQNELYSWRDFRRVVEDASFRRMCFDMLRVNDTYRLYFKNSEEATYFYDDNYDAEEDVQEVQQKMEDEAAEYEEIRSIRRKRGKKPQGKSVKEDHADLDFDNSLDDEQ